MSPPCCVNLILVYTLLLLLLLLQASHTNSSGSHIATTLQLLASTSKSSTGTGAGAVVAGKKADAHASSREKLTILKGDGKVYVCSGGEALLLKAQKTTSIKTTNNATSNSNGSGNTNRRDKYEISKCKFRSIQGSKEGVNGNILIEIEADAIFGIFELPLGSFLGVITSSTPSPLIGEGVREVQEIDLIQITEINRKQKDYRSKKEEQKEAVSMLSDAFSVHSLYFSTGEFDVTRFLIIHVFIDVFLRYFIFSL